MTTVKVTRGPGQGTVYDLTAAGSHSFGKGDLVTHQLVDSTAELFQFTLTSSVSPRGLELADPNSLRGVLVNGVPKRRAILCNGDRIHFGATELLVCAGGSGLETRPPPAPVRAPAGDSRLTRIARDAALVAAIFCFLAVVVLTSILFVQREEIASLSKRKASLESIAALELRMQLVTDPAAVEELQHELDDELVKKER